MMADNGLVYFDVLLACAYRRCDGGPAEHTPCPTEVAYQLEHADPVICVTDRHTWMSVEAVATVPVSMRMAPATERWSRRTSGVLLRSRLSPTMWRCP